MCAFREVTWQPRSTIKQSCLSTFHLCRPWTALLPLVLIASELLRSTICESAELTGAQWRRLSYYRISSSCLGKRRTARRTQLPENLMISYKNISVSCDDLLFLIVIFIKWYYILKFIDVWELWADIRKSGGVLEIYSMIMTCNLSFHNVSAIAAAALRIGLAVAHLCNTHRHRRNHGWKVGGDLT